MGAARSTRTVGAEGDHDGRRFGERSRRRLAVAAGGVVLVVVAVLVGSLGVEVDPGPDEADTTVELPPPEALPEGREGSAPSATPRPTVGETVADRHEVACEPEGCERWRLPVSRGTVRVVDDLVVHAGTEHARVDRATGERRPPDHVLRVMAIDAVSGAPRWETVVPWPGVDRPLPAVTSVTGDGRMVASAPGEAHLLDLQDGTRRWSRPVDGQVMGVRPVDGEDLLAWLVPFAGSGGVRDQQGPVQPDTGAGSLTRLDGDTGELRWRHDQVQPVWWDHDVVVVRSGGEDARLGGLDLATGTVIWEEPLEADAWVVAGDDRLVIGVGSTGQVLEPRAGRPGALLELPPAEERHLVGATLVLLGPDDGGRRTVTAVGTGARADTTVLEQVVSTAFVPRPGAPSRGPVTVAPAEALVALLREDGTDRLVALDRQGGVAWDRELAGEAGSCCPRLAIDEGSSHLAVLPPPGLEDDVEVVDARDGRTVRTVAAPAREPQATLGWRGGLVVRQRPSQGLDRVDLHGVGGSVTIRGELRLAVEDPVPVLWTGELLVGLAPEVVHGS